LIDVSIREDLGTSVENTCNREPLISVVIPAYNEATNIEKLFEGLKRELDVLQCYEVILVDDGSSDGTADLARRVASRLGLKASIIRLDVNSGKPRALLEGFSRSSGMYVGVIDADLQYDPKDLVAMVRNAKDKDYGYDAVFGERIDLSRDLVRKLVSLGAKILAKLFIREARKARDPTTEIYVVRREKLEKCLEAIRPRIKIGLEILIRCRLNRVSWIPVTIRPREGGESKFKLTWIPSYLLQILELTDYFTLRYIVGALVALPISILLWNYIGILAPFIGAAVKWIFIWRDIGLASTLAVKALATAIKVAEFAAWPVTALIELILIHMLRGTRI
jgi:dolichol-phosphate mannosyltransferase